MNIENAISIATTLIASEEGFRSKAYYDVNGYAIGYGNHYYSNGKAVQASDTITLSDAKNLLKFYAAQFAHEIAPYIKVDITDDQMAALTDMAYNCGSGRVRDSELLKLINARAPVSQIETEYQKTCVTVKGVYNAGLFDRRVTELKLFMQEASVFVKENKWQIVVTGVLIAALIGFYIWRFTKEK